MGKDFFVQEIQAHSGMLYRVAYTILRNDDACRDAMQETSLKAWEKRHSLREERYFRTWITRILINTCRDEKRRRKHDIPIEAMDSLPQSAVPPPDPALAIALATLPDTLRLPLVLCHAEGMAYTDITKVLRLPEPTVRGRIHRAKKLLLKELSE